MSGREINKVVFLPIQTQAELPAVGTAEGVTLDFKAVVPSDWSPFRLARQVAAFANSVGGTLLIGAKDENDGTSSPCPDRQPGMNSAAV